MYETPYADPGKGMRKTTLADAKRHGWVASVTSILQILDKPGLNSWLQDRVLESALTLPREKDESDKEYMTRIKQDSREISTLARDEGSRIHDALEQSFKDKRVEPEYFDLTKKVRQKVYDYFQVSDGWIAEQSFSTISYGGKVDLHHPEMNIVIDFKTKEKFKYTKIGKITKMAYDEHCMQLIAYACGLDMPIAKCINVFVEYSGEIVFHEWSDDETIRAWKMFNHCLELWKLQKNYFPEKWEEKNESRRY